MMDLALKILTYASFVISGAVVTLTAIAPLTKTNWDNKLLAALVWIHDTLLSKVLPLHTIQAKTPPTDSV